MWVSSDWTLEKTEKMFAFFFKLVFLSLPNRYYIGKMVNVVWNVGLTEPLFWCAFVYMNDEIVIFKIDDETINVEVRFEDETAWLTQKQMARLFGKSKSTINEHIKNIFSEGELEEKVAVRKFRITTPHGAIEGKTQIHEVNFYNIDVIISVGYRVKSLRGTQFRLWAIKRPNEYIRKCFTLDDEYLKNLGGEIYWQELIARILGIRACEKVLYRQVSDVSFLAVNLIGLSIYVFW